MNEIHTKDIRATYISMIRKLQSYVDGDLSITHIRCTREPYANLYSYKVHKICNEFKIKYNSVMCNPDADIPTYIDVMARLEEANKSDCDGILFDTPFKQNQYIRNITSKVSSDKDMECFSDINYGKYLLGKPTRITPCITASINDLIYLHGIGNEYKRILIISDISGDNYGITMSNTFNSSVISVVSPRDADFLSTHLYEYDVIISLLYDSKIFITKDTINVKPDINQLILDYGWCSDTKDSTIDIKIFNKDKIIYYDLANDLMEMYIFNAIHNMLNRIVND